MAEPETTVEICAPHDHVAIRTTRRAGWQIALAACLLGLAVVGATPPPAAAAVRSCSLEVDSPPLVTILSVRNMSCHGAARYYLRHDGSQNVPLRKGEVTRIGDFRCRVYEDLTPPGPSDSDVRIRCSHGRRAFRFEYAV